MGFIPDIFNFEIGLAVRNKLNVLMKFYNAVVKSDSLFNVERLDASYVKDATPTTTKFLRDDGTWQTVATNQDLEQTLNNGDSTGTGNTIYFENPPVLNSELQAKVMTVNHLQKLVSSPINIADVQLKSNKGIASGYASLGADTKHLQAESRASNVTYNSANGVITYTWADGSTQTIDLPIENLFQNASYNSSTQKLTLTTNGGGTLDVDLATLVDLPEIVISASSNPSSVPTTGQKLYLRADNGAYWINVSGAWTGGFLGVTGAEKTAITHSNRTVLDLITEPFTTGLKTTYDATVNSLTTLLGRIQNSLAADGSGNKIVTVDAINANVQTKQVIQITSSTAPTINTTGYRRTFVDITAQSGNINLSTNLSGTPQNGDIIWYQIKDNGTARTITAGSLFEAKGVDLPTTTIVSKRLNMCCTWDSTTSKWGCLSLIYEV